MSDRDDDSTGLVLGVVAGVVFLVIASVIGVAVWRTMHLKAAVNPGPAGAVVIEEIMLIDAPVSGDLVATLFFEVDKAEMPVESPAIMESVLKALVDAPGRKVVLSGFHDASGDPAHNAELAKQRAVRARSVLLAAGVTPDRVMLRKPAVTTGDGTPEQARRVEIHLVD